MPLTFPRMPDKLTANETAILEYLSLIHISEPTRH